MIRADHHTHTEADAAAFDRAITPDDTDRPDVDHGDRATGRRVDDRALVADLVAAQANHAEAAIMREHDTADRVPSLVDYRRVGIALGMSDPDAMDARTQSRIDREVRARGLVGTWEAARMLEADE